MYNILYAVNASKHHTFITNTAHAWILKQQDFKLLL
jgi:hypothetical protein